jgi:aspartate-semialdehyde dehydrogenase
MAEARTGTAGKGGRAVAIAGATGAVGREMAAVLEQRKFPVKSLRLLASPRSAGTRLPFAGEEIVVEELTERSFESVDLVLFSAGGLVSKRFAPFAAKAGAVVVDNSSAFRMQPDVPLVVPEINPDALVGHRGIVANPNCSTILFLMAVVPIHRVVRIGRAVVSSYQAVSGSGWKGIAELRSQVEALAAGRAPVPSLYPYPIANNVLPFVDRILEGGHTPEELKLHNETTKILGDPRVKVTATCVRVPVERAHSEAIHLELERKITSDEARALLRSAPGVRVVDDPLANRFPTPLEAAGGDDVLVGRVREDLAFPTGLALFACMDQLRKGAALNAVQIAEEMIRRSLL